MNAESIALMVFLVFLTFLLLKNRNKLTIQKIIWPVFYINKIFFSRKRTDALLYEGIELAKQGKHNLAGKCFDEALRIKLKNPENIDELAFKGIALYHLGKHKEAIRFFDKIIVKELKHPERTNALIYKGIALGKLKKYDKAIECFNTALKTKINIPILYFALCKTKLGLKFMDSLARRFPKLINIISRIGVFLGLLGMAAIIYFLVEGWLKSFFVPVAASVSFVLPVKVKGTFFVPFFYWIISIFIIAAVHEFCHGIVARLHKIPVKSSGFAFLCLIVPIIPAAFVEPDEKNLSKKRLMQKLSVLAAGPVANLITGLIFIALFILLTVPVVSYMTYQNGVEIQGFTHNESSAKLAGLPEQTTITYLDGTRIATVDNFSDYLIKKHIGDKIVITTKNGTYSAKIGSDPKNATNPFLGVYAKQSYEPKPGFESGWKKRALSSSWWILGLFYWLYLLSVGIGLFNLLPMGPLDGGLMSKELLLSGFRKKETALKIWYWISIFFVMVILTSLLSGLF